MVTGVIVRIDKEFLEIVKKVIEEFKDKNDIDISIAKASKIIAEKINKAGGVTLGN